jgi:hypothetical protein
MTESLFASSLRYLSSLVLSPKSSPSSSHDVSDRNRVLRETASPSAKRKAEDNEDDIDFVRPTKKRALSAASTEPAQLEENNEPVSTLWLPAASSGTKTGADRRWMPPASKMERNMRNMIVQRTGLVPKGESADWVPGEGEDDDELSFGSSALSPKRADPLDIDFMEEARRHIAAITLPENSGTWSQTEREIFFHLAYRGFETLLPQNWMIDFDTLPISVFAHENATEPPLIHSNRDNEFRASHALRRLFEAGHDARDRIPLSPMNRSEKVLEKAVKRYMHWALTDVGLRPRSMRDFIPVHVVVAKRKGEATLQTLKRITRKLERLSAKLQQSHNIRPSVETMSPGSISGNETKVADDDAASPTLIGLVITSAVVTIVTLSPFAPPTIDVPVLASPPPSDLIDQGSSDTDPDKLRIIAELDFSQKDQDVWNALGVAITAMQIRKEALKVNPEVDPNDLSAMDWDGMSIVTESRFEDDLDGMSVISSRLQLEDDDPDL